MSDLTEEEKQAENDRLDNLLAKQEKNKRRGRKPVEVNTSGMRGIKGDTKVICVTKRKVGLDNNVTSEVGEEIYLTKEIAEKLQDVGAIKVKL